jgi:hypothetical protein
MQVVSLLLTAETIMLQLCVKKRNENVNFIQELLLEGSPIMSVVYSYRLNL